MIYLKKYSQDSDYQQIVFGEGNTPNVSFTVDKRKVYYNPKLKVPDYAVFWGLCKAKTVNAYWGDGSGTSNIGYADNHDGTYTYYGFNNNHAVHISDRFVWYNSDDVINLYINPKASISELRNNRFNSKVIQNYYFDALKIKSNSLRESFYNCLKLQKLNISNWDLSECTSLYALLAMNIGSDNTDENITALREVNMPDDMPTPKCTEAHKMFAWNRGLKKITGMKSLNFSAVTDFSEMFCEDRALSSVDFKIDNWVTSACTDIHSMFLQCYYLDLSALGDLKTWNVSNVTNFSNCFARNATSSIDISGWNMSSADSVQAMFMQYSTPKNNLKSINMSGIILNPDKLSNASNMFWKCNNLQELNLTGIDNVTKSHGLIEFIEDQLLFDIPDTIKSVNFHLILDDGSYTYDNDYEQGWVLDNCVFSFTMENNATVPDEYVSRHASDGTIIVSKTAENYALGINDFNNLTTLDMVSFNLDKRAVPYSDLVNLDFKLCAKLKTVDFKKIPVKIASFVFKSCPELISVDLSGTDMSSIDSFQYVFQDSPKLTTIDMSDTNMADRLSTQSDAFLGMISGCTSLAKIILKGISSTVVNAMMSSNFGNADEAILKQLSVITDDGTYVYKDNSWQLANKVITFADANVKKICVDNWGSNNEITEDQAATVTSLNNKFQGNSAITSFDELKYFSGVTSLNDQEFNECKNLTSICLDSITNTIGEKALRSVGLSGELTIYAKDIKSVFLSNVNTVTRVNMPNVVNFAQGTSINGYCLGNLSELKTIDFGPNLRSAVDSNFCTGSSSIANVIIRSKPSTTKWNNAYNGTNDSCVYWVPDNYLAAWKSKFPSFTRFKPFSEAPDGLI